MSDIGPARPIILEPLPETAPAELPVTAPPAAVPERETVLA